MIAGLLSVLLSGCQAGGGTVTDGTKMEANAAGIDAGAAKPGADAADGATKPGAGAADGATEPDAGAAEKQAGASKDAPGSEAAALPYQFVRSYGIVQSEL